MLHTTDLRRRFHRATHIIDTFLHGAKHGDIRVLLHVDEVIE